MRFPFAQKKEVIKGVQYGTTVTIRYVLPKRELVKIAATVAVTEMFLRPSARKAAMDKANTGVEKVNNWIDSASDRATS